LVDKTSGKIDKITTSISQLVKFMDIQTTRERETESLVASKGGAEAVLNVKSRFFTSVQADIVLIFR
jgi:hypothetical protein